jgi:hypothetical protein
MTLVGDVSALGNCWGAWRSMVVEGFGGGFAFEGCAEGFGGWVNWVRCVEYNTQMRLT